MYEDDRDAPGFAFGVVLSMSAIAFMIFMIAAWLRDRVPSWWW